MRKLTLKELNRLTPGEFAQLEKLPLTVVLDNIRSGMNVGSIFRSCDAFAIREIILCGITARPPHREIAKTAIGAQDTVKWRYFPKAAEAITSLKREGHYILGVEQTDQSHPLTEVAIEVGQPVAVIVGNEVDGLNEDLLELLDQAIEISQFGTKHSLNVAVCCGIVLWQISRLLRG